MHWYAWRSDVCQFLGEVFKALLLDDLCHSLCVLLCSFSCVFRLFCYLRLDLGVCFRSLTLVEVVVSLNLALCDLFLLVHVQFVVPNRFSVWYHRVLNYDVDAAVDEAVTPSDCNLSFQWVPRLNSFF